MIRLFLLLLILMAPAALRAEEALMGGDGPIDVTADQSLEWYEEQKMYVARGNAKAIRGGVTIEADVLAAYERDVPASGDKPATTQMYRLSAEGNVRITADKQQAYGDKAAYDLDQKLMVLTGGDLRFVSGEDVVTARDSLEYWEGRKIAVARGKAVADRSDRHIESDLLVAEFGPGPKGDEVKRMTARGNVTIITASNDVARSDGAVYDLSRDVAVIKGNVRITRGETQMQGDIAEVDFKSGQSRLLNQTRMGRVHALLQPGGKKPPASTTATPSSIPSRTTTARR
jgi:lipopolysaccharide export system protein LptA